MFGRVVRGGVRVAGGFGKNFAGGVGQEMLGQSMGIDTSRTTGRPTMGGFLGGMMVQQGMKSVTPPAFNANAASGRRFG
jgi:hypothetical protein